MAGARRRGSRHGLRRFGAALAGLRVWRGGRWCLDRSADDEFSVLDRGGFTVEDRAEDGANLGPEAGEPAGVDRQGAEDNVERLGAVAVRGEELHAGNVAISERDLAEVAERVGLGVENVIGEALALASKLEDDLLALRPERLAGRLGGGGIGPAAHGHAVGLLHVRLLGIEPGFFDGAVDVRAVELDQADERGVGLVEVLGGNREAQRRAVVLGGLGELADDDGSRDREVAADLERLGRFPAGLGLAGADLDPQAVFLALDLLLFAERFGVKCGLVDLRGGERPGIIVDIARQEASQEQNGAVHSRSSIDGRSKGNDRKLVDMRNCRMGQRSATHHAQAATIRWVALTDPPYDSDGRLNACPTALRRTTDADAGASRTAFPRRARERVMKTCYGIRPVRVPRGSVIGTRAGLPRLSFTGSEYGTAWHSFTEFDP